MSLYNSNINNLDIKDKLVVYNNDLLLFDY